MINNTTKQPTFEEFSASCVNTTWNTVANKLGIDARYTDAPRANMYLDSFYIEDYVEEGYEHETGQRGRYVLVIDRDVHYLDDLKYAEKLLYDGILELYGEF